MVSFEQNFQSFQVQFNAFYSKLESQKKAGASVAPETQGTLQRIQTKLQQTLDDASKKKSSAEKGLQLVKKEIEFLSENLLAADNLPYSVQKALKIKELIQTLHVTIFSPDLSVDQASSLREESDQHLATANWIVGRASTRVKEKYPLTCKVMSSCTLQIQSGKYGERLKQALVQSMPEIWSIESLTKLVIIILAKTGQALSTVDCFEINEQTTKTLEQIRGFLVKEEDTVVEIFILNPEKLSGILADCCVTLNRFTQACQVAREDALGLMNLLQLSLNQTNFLDELEDLLKKGQLEEAFTFVTRLQESSKKCRAYLYLTHKLHDLKTLSKIHECLLTLRQGIHQKDDALEEFVQALLAKETPPCELAYEATTQMNDNDAAASLIREIAKLARILNPQCFLKIAKAEKTAVSHEDRCEFFKEHASKNLAKALSVLPPSQNRAIQAELFPGLCHSLSTVLKMIPHKKAKSLAQTIYTRFDQCDFLELATHCNKQNLFVILHLATLLSPNLLSTTMFTMAITKLDNEYIKNQPQIALEALLLIPEHIERSFTLFTLITHLTKIAPLKAIEAFIKVPLASYDEPLQNMLLEACKNAAAPSVYAFLRLVTFAPNVCDRLFLQLAHTKNESLARAAAFSLRDPALRQEALSVAYETFRWQDPQGILEHAKALQTPEQTCEFTQFAIKQASKVSFNSAYQLAFALPHGNDRDTLFVTFANSVEVGDNVIWALKILSHITDQARREKEILDRALLCYDDDKAGVERLIPELLSGSALNSFYLRLSEKLAYTHPQKAAQLLSLIKGGAAVKEAIDQLLKIWAYIYPEHARKLVHSLQDTNLKQHFSNKLQTYGKYQ